MGEVSVALNNRIYHLRFSLNLHPDTLRTGLSPKHAHYHFRKKGFDLMQNLADARAWFCIKSKLFCEDGSEHVWETIQFSRYVDEDLKKIVDPVIQRNAYFAHPENLLLRMISDDRSHIRVLGFRRIMKVRKEKLQEIRRFVIPSLNFAASDYTDLIDWKNCQVTEPPILPHLSDDDLQSLVIGASSTAIEIPKCPCHTQSEQRTVKIVTESASAVCGWKNRDGYIRAKIQSRAIVPKFSSKVQSVRFSSSGPTQLNEESDNTNILVYTGPLKKKIKWVKVISLSSSAIALTLQPLVIYNLSQINLPMAIMAGIVSTMFLSTPLLLHWITKRYVVELNFDNDTGIFTAKTLTLFNRIREMKFTADDVSVPTLPGILSSFHVRNVPLFVDGRMVEDPDAYAHMMGFDKPFDMLIGESIDGKKEQ